jgi:hypothetical protein
MIRAAVAGQPGLSGGELLEVLRHLDFSGVASPHTKSGPVSDEWLAGYIRGGLRRGYLNLSEDC